MSSRRSPRRHPPRRSLPLLPLLPLPVLLFLLLPLLLSLLPACSRPPQPSPGSAPGAAAGPGAAAAPGAGPGAGAGVAPGFVGRSAPRKVPGLPIGDGYTVGNPKIFANLAVFPVYASVQEHIGDFTTLDAALERGTAEVRELGAAPAPDSPPQAPSAPQNQDQIQQQQIQQQQIQMRGDGAQVNTLVIENKGDLQILVLAGTIVKGGKQDRQIGQDFLVGAKQTVPVDAFCVEHGRWTGVREGAATGGKFTTMKVLANSKVREAGQYKRDQSEVWSKVGETNRAHKKQTASDTLIASVEDGEIAKQRETLARDAMTWLGQVESAEDVVGLAYAVDGQVRGVRFFMNRKLFLMFQDTLAGTAAQDAITAQEEARAAGKSIASGQAEPAAVERFIAGVQAAKAEAQATRAGNVNEYQFADEGYGSAVMAPAPAATAGTPGAAPPAKPKAITKDFLAK